VPVVVTADNCTAHPVKWRLSATYCSKDCCRNRQQWVTNDSKQSDEDNHAFWHVSHASSSMDRRTGVKQKTTVNCFKKAGFVLHADDESGGYSDDIEACCRGPWWRRTAWIHNNERVSRVCRRGLHSPHAIICQLTMSSVRPWMLPLKPTRLLHTTPIY